MESTGIVFTASGGQGVITTAIILARSATIFEGKNAIQSQSYGAAARGGATRADILISEGNLYYPKVESADVLVALMQEGYDKYANVIRPGGLMIVDPRYVTPGNINAKIVPLPMYDTVVKEIGKPIVYSVCVLGGLIGMTGICKPESAINVIKDAMPPAFFDMNKKALELGIALGKDAA
ncbi:MAG: 2-oxoglutarate ferredoxin oxidoreductase subunit gamma [Desulfobacter postgatei]|uniref:2-oxoglutarate ferredoxin oxidoreductase subunit gamma n=1 Tax=Desulfobacter postgatei TaxID=2293 RepID=A0A2G6MR74_9BACT|nr:MAG: 2-oxoglutarate ferredoxin oxidoreductase subunit gamma [Desulfobacter postgatei]